MKKTLLISFILLLLVGCTGKVYNNPPYLFETNHMPTAYPNWLYEGPQ